MNRAGHRLNGTVLCGLVCAFACGCDPNVGPPTKLSTRAETPEPIGQLPAHVHSSAGEVTLFADYDDVRGDYVVLYLVNRMDRRLGFSAQDDDVYAKLEAENDLGAWERAQTHWGGSCVVSVSRPSLRPGEFFRFLGYFPSEGEPRTVRYRVYSETAFVLPDESSNAGFFGARNAEKIPLNLVSNTGAGRAKAADIADTRRDSWAIRYGTGATVRALALDAAESAHPDRPLRLNRLRRSEAVAALRRFPDKATAAVLETLLEDDDPSIRRRAIRVLAIIGPECSEAEMRFQQLLEDEDVNRRASAIASLAERAVTVDVVRDMQRLLENEEPMFRASAVFVLMKSCKKLPEAHAVLEAYKTDPDPLVQSILDISEKHGWCPSSTPGSDDE